MKKIFLELEDKLYYKLEDIIFFETESKDILLNSINKKISDIKKNTSIKEIEFVELTGGYYIKYTTSYKHVIFCNALTEVMIHLRYLDKIIKIGDDLNENIMDNYK